MSRRSSTLALIAVIAASVFGYILAQMIPSAVFPEITFRRATILADSGDLPAEQMLASVTRALEETAYSVVGVTMVRSTTTRGSTEVDVTFGEDKARTHLGNGPENLAVLRKTALNMLQAHPAKRPLQHKILRAGWRDDFLLEIFAHASKPQST